jgi:hypothetical protein
MVKLSDIDFPVTFKKQLLFKSGNMNGLLLPMEEVNKAPSNTKWDKFNSSLIYSHKDTNKLTNQPTEDYADAWAGNVKNIQSDGLGNIYGDVNVYEPSAAIATGYGEAPFAISAGIKYREGNSGEARDISFRNFSLVSNPAVKDKDIFINFSLEDNNLHDGFRYANFSAVIDSTSAEGSQVDGHTNNKIVTSKKKMRTCKMCNANYEDEEDDDEDEKEDNGKEKEKDEVEMPKDEFVKEHEKLVDILKSGTPEEQKKEAEDQAKELKETKKDKDMSSEKLVDSPGTKAQLQDVINKKDWTMEKMDGKENTPLGEVTPVKREKITESNVNYSINDKLTERRLQDNSNMKTEKERSSVESVANFDESKVEEKSETKETPKEEKKEVPKQEPTQTKEFVNASPMVDEKVIADVVNRISERIIPNLKPAPMTTQEFAKQSQDPQEDAVERLAKVLVRK